jgi:Zn-dependent protease with chaperone function
MGPIVITAMKSSCFFFMEAFVGATPLHYSLNNSESDDCKKMTTIKSKIEAKAKALGLKKNPQVKIVTTANHPAQAHGIEFSPFGCVITINPNLISQNAEDFLIAHELAHIKSNDRFTIPGVGFLASLTSSIGLSILLSIGILSAPVSSGCILVAMIIGLVAQVAFSRYREVQADIKALSVCKYDEKGAMKDHLINIRKARINFRGEKNISLLTQIYRKLTISETGEFRLDIMHPSLASRIQRIEYNMLRL